MQRAARTAERPRLGLRSIDWDHLNHFKINDRYCDAVSDKTPVTVAAPMTESTRIAGIVRATVTTHSS